MNIISTSFKNLFNTTIDSILAENALTISCDLKFNNSTAELCYNCYYDSLSKSSSGRYNTTGPYPFAAGSVCPVCVGIGQLQNNSKIQNLYLAIIFDSKYFLNISNKVINIPDSSIQSICSSDKLSLIRNCNELAISEHPNKRYERLSDPMLCGLGNLDYIITFWTPK
jgi:hypothetical protein